MSKILVTGASGFIGKHLVPSLLKAGHDITAANRDNGDITDVSTWHKFPLVDVVIHLAGKSFVPASWEDPGSFINCNLIGTIEALNYCKKNNARLIFLSSYLYGNPESLPIAEDSPLVATNPYGLSKKLGEESCLFYFNSFGINITILRPFNVYGSGQPENFLIPSIIRQVKEGGVIRVKDLVPKRDYVYINDLIEAIIKSVDCISGYNIFNIGSGESHSVEELIQIVQGIKKTSLAVLSDNERRKDEIMNTIADIRLAKSHLNWTPKWSFIDGLKNIMLADIDK